MSLKYDLHELTIWQYTLLSRTFNPFQSNFSANHILMQLLFVLGEKEVGGLLVIILQF
jgi:hypothetical protein